MVTRTRYVPMWVKWACAGPLLSVLVAAAGLLAYITLFADGTPDYASPTPTRDREALLFVAVGDSFISGEGASRYLAGTNSPGNSCHRANTGYPYLVATVHSARLVNATCSGAVLADFWERQYPKSPASTYGGVPQVEAIISPRISPEETAQPGTVDVVLLSIGGNDAGFAEIVKACLNQNCLRYEPQWMRQLDALEPDLEVFYPRIREVSGSARVLVVTYPEPFVVGDCVQGLTEAESRFLLKRFLPRLNQLIAWESQIAGLEVVDTREAFAGARDCEPGVTRETAAMNTVDVGRFGGTPADITRGSFHPRELGHQLLAKAVLDHLSRPPTPDPLGCQPFGCPPGPPPHPPIPPPGGQDMPFPRGTACSGGTLSSGPSRYLKEGQTQVEITSTPGARVCYALAGERWRSEVAGEDGVVAINSEAVARAKNPALTVIHRAESAGWTQVTLLAPGHLLAPEAPWWQRLSGLMIAAILAAAGLALTPHALELALRRRGGGRAPH